MTAPSNTLPHKRLFLIPLDARPVCYEFPQQLAQSAGLELCLPSPKLLGQLKTPADLKALQRWVKQHLFEKEPVIVALDTLAYGGLIAGRVDNTPLETLKQRVDQFFAQIQTDGVYGFSSILRIPAYNNAEEEPDYWAHYGKQLYDYSEHWHRLNGNLSIEHAEGLPKEVLDDFLDRRERHHQLNQYALACLKHNKLDYLTFCQDDTGEYGINVWEAGELQKEITAEKLGEKAHTQTGADEVAAVMLARWLSHTHTAQQREPVRIYPVYSSETGKDTIARFDGIAINEITHRAIAACGAQRAETPEAADIWLLVHTPNNSKQGDHCIKEKADTNPEQHDVILEWLARGIAEGQPVMLADVAHANGSDAVLSEKIVSRFEDLTALYGYAGWNTPGNTLGSCVAMGVVRYLAEYHTVFNQEAFYKLLLVRFADDWLYQSDVRQRLRAEQNGNKELPDEGRLNVEMANGIALLKTRLGLDDVITHCSFPCKRTFEVEIALS